MTIEASVAPRPDGRIKQLVLGGSPRICNYLVSAGLGIVLLMALGTFRVDGLRAVRDTWGGQARPTLFVQDLIGARALLDGMTPYPILSEGAERVGLNWPIAHRSTHPPTAFLFVLPLAGLPWDTATAVWMAAMIGVLGLAAVVLGWPRAATPAVAVSLIWAPAAWSLC